MCIATITLTLMTIMKMILPYDWQRCSSPYPQFYIFSVFVSFFSKQIFMFQMLCSGPGVSMLSSLSNIIILMLQRLCLLVFFT
ncbi:hypothetical protein EB796_001576 [Bugula neritina]|uniref:Uncharacterized protein n=1 Tax=Bugula neritina TaxID=10212 RepID=A0A7J7KPV6_BUGNE|nr:hypothetical protein EB796_001576 [Bugula neritina]